MARRCILPSAHLCRRFFGYTPTKVIKRSSKFDLLHVPPLEIRYDYENEVPILVKTLSPSIDDHISNLTHPSKRLMLYDDISKYAINCILKEIFLHVKMLPENSPVYFADFHDYKSIVKTFQKLGSLFTYKLGTCCLKGQHGDLRVVHDTGVWKTVERDTERFYGYAGPWKFIKPTGYKMFCIPKNVFVWDTYRVCKQEMQVRYMAFARREAERLGIKIEDAETIADSLTQQMKVAIEVERSAIGQGNLVFFMEPQQAKDPLKVFSAIKKHINLESGLSLVHYAKHLRDEGDFMRTYSIEQELDPCRLPA